MAASPSVETREAVRAGSVVDIAGSDWPVYKLEALTIGLLVFLVAALVLGSAQAGVLLGAGLGVLLWTTGRWRAAGTR
ncbi:hypothetical protein [Nocardia sp. X0981]